jgi:oligopeptide transport system permease protein
MLRLAPGGPFDSERQLPPEVKANLERRYHLDKPVYEQFLIWLKSSAQGDFGESIQYGGKSVSTIILDSIPYSILLGFLALTLALLVGVPIGCLAALKRNTFFDQLVMFLSMSGLNLPNFLLATFLISIFSLKFGWFPPALWEGPSSVVLPTITLGLRPTAMVARLLRTSIIESLSADYIRTAESKGLSWFSILFKHALRNSIIPLISLLGPLAANLITGSFVIEVIFQIPGMGKYFVHAILNRDYALVMGVTLVYGVILISLNLAVDFLSAWVDPRIKLEEAI